MKAEDIIKELGQSSQDIENSCLDMCKDTEGNVHDLIRSLCTAIVHDYRSNIEELWVPALRKLSEENDRLIKELEAEKCKRADLEANLHKPQNSVSIALWILAAYVIGSGILLFLASDL